MRLFIAFGVSEEAKKELMRLQDIFNDVGNIKFIRDFHCTLKFLGYVSDKEAKEVVSCLKNVKFKSFEVCLDRLGVFPSEKFIRVLWVGLKGKVSDLQNKVDSCLVGLFNKEDNFHAHVTLGRVKFLKNKESFLKLLKSTEVRKICFKVEYIELIKSELTPEGPVYETIEKIQ
jgi:2'-5' RNA ligase